MFRYTLWICASCLENKLQGRWFISLHSLEALQTQTGSTLCSHQSFFVPRVDKKKKTDCKWIYSLQPLCVLQKVQNNIHQTFHFFLSVSSNGLNGTISVYPLEGSKAGMMPTPASANSPTAYTILDVDQNAYLFVGGIFGTVKVFVKNFITLVVVVVVVFWFFFFIVFFLLCSILESRSSKDINILRLHGRDLLGW